jgi:hypothetical protein
MSLLHATTNWRSISQMALLMSIVWEVRNNALVHYVSWQRLVLLNCAVITAHRNALQWTLRVAQLVKAMASGRISFWPVVVRTHICVWELPVNYILVGLERTEIGTPFLGRDCLKILSIRWNNWIPAVTVAHAQRSIQISKLSVCVCSRSHRGR